MSENVATYAVLHHTGDTSPLPQLKKVNDYHKLRWDFISTLGWYVGYHYFIERNGVTTQTRANSEEGAHTKGHNLESVGIALAGNFDIDAPSEAQLNALALLMEELAETYGVYDFPLHNHSELSDTHCPGFWFHGNAFSAHIARQKLTFLRRVLAWITSHFQK